MNENEQNNAVSEVENENPTLTESEKTVENETAASATEEKEQSSAALNGNSAALAEEYARRDYFAARRYKRTPLILALIGLMLSFFYGAGIAFSVAAIVTAAVRSRKIKSPNFKWATAIGITGAVICLAFYGMLIAAVCLPQTINY